MGRLLLPWCAVVLILISGCGTEKPPPLGEGAQSTVATRPVSRMSVEQVDAIRATLVECGGSLECNADGQPIAIDLASDRGEASLDAARAILECRQLTSLRIRAGQLSPDMLRDIGTLDQLESLMIQGGKVDDSILALWAEDLVSLRRLTLRGLYAVSDQGIASLIASMDLTHLSLIEMEISGKALEAIASQPQLVSLDLRMCNNIDGDALQSIVGMPKLRSLSLGGYGIDNRAATILAQFPHLDSLSIEDSSLDADGLVSLTNSKTLTEHITTLAFARCAGISDDALLQLSRFTKLRRLLLRDVPITGEFLLALSIKGQLDTLVLNQTFLADEAFESISECQNLTRLELSQNFLTPSAIEKIATLGNLTFLNLSQCELNDDMLGPLSRLTKLKTLNLDGNSEISQAAVLKLHEHFFAKKP